MLAILGNAMIKNSGLNQGLNPNLNQGLNQWKLAQFDNLAYIIFRVLMIPLQLIQWLIARF